MYSVAVNSVQVEPLSIEYSTIARSKKSILQIWLKYKFTKVKPTVLKVFYSILRVSPCTTLAESEFSPPF